MFVNIGQWSVQVSNVFIALIKFKDIDKIKVAISGNALMNENINI
jgi:hypothetical protein